MNDKIVKRLNNELANNYTITTYDNNQRPTQLTFEYKGVLLYIDLGGNYPFRPPNSIHDITNLWSHQNYALYNSLVTKYKNDQTCLYCDTLCSDTWSPSCKIIDLIGKFTEKDKLISTCLKLELIFFRNAQPVELPEDVIFYVIFPFLF